MEGSCLCCGQDITPLLTCRTTQPNYFRRILRDMTRCKRIREIRREETPTRWWMILSLDTHVIDLFLTNRQYDYILLFCMWHLWLIILMIVSPIIAGQRRHLNSEWSPRSFISDPPESSAHFGIQRKSYIFDAFINVYRTIQFPLLLTTSRL